MRWPPLLQGQGIYAFVTLKEGYAPSDQLKKELVSNVRSVIGAFAAPDVIHWVRACACVCDVLCVYWSECVCVCVLGLHLVGGHVAYSLA